MALGNKLTGESSEWCIVLCWCLTTYTGAVVGRVVGSGAGRCNYVVLAHFVRRGSGGPSLCLDSGVDCLLVCIHVRFYLLFLVAVSE